MSMLSCGRVDCVQSFLPFCIPVDLLVKPLSRTSMYPACNNPTRILVIGDVQRIYADL